MFFHLVKLGYGNSFIFLYREMFYCPSKLSFDKFHFHRNVLLFSQVRLEHVFELYVFHYDLVYQVLILTC